MSIPDPATTEWVPIWNPTSQGPVGPQGPQGPMGPVGPAGPLGGAGTINRSPTWTSGVAMGDSVAFDTGGGVNIDGSLGLVSHGQPGIYINELDGPVNNRNWRIVCAGGGIWFQTLLDSGGASVTPLQVQRDHTNLYGQTAFTGNAGEWTAIMYAHTTPNSSNGMVIYGGTGVNDNAFYVMNRAANTLGLQIRGDMIVYIPTCLVIPVGANKWAPS